MNALNNLFHLKENNTTAGTEIRAGLTTFLAMAYIIFVNPVFLSVTGMDSDGAMIATCLAAAIGTILCAVLSNKPFALAPGMGMNAFFAYTLCAEYGYTWQQALAMVFISGILFLVVILVIGDRVVNVIPKNLKHAITIGIGFLLTLIGLLDGGLIDMSTGVPALGNVKSPAILIAIAGVVITLILTVRNVRGSLIIGMIATLVISLICQQTALPATAVMAPTALSKVFLKLDFGGLIGNGSIMTLIALIISMTIVDMFDTIGYLVGTGSRAGMLDKDGNMKGAKKVILADAGATVLGSLCGTSTVTTFAESTSGIAAGGRTGLTGIVTSICFLAAMFFSPIAGMMNSAVTAPALIVVGMFLMMDIRHLDMSSMADALPALLTIIFIPMTYSITAGIGVGFISYIVCTIAAGKVKKMNIGTVILGIVFLLYFIL